MLMIFLIINWPYFVYLGYLLIPDFYPRPLNFYEASRFVHPGWTPLTDTADKRTNRETYNRTKERVSVRVYLWSLTLLLCNLVCVANCVLSVLNKENDDDDDAVAGLSVSRIAMWRICLADRWFGAVCRCLCLCVSWRFYVFLLRFYYYYYYYYYDHHHHHHNHRHHYYYCTAFTSLINK